VTLDKRYKRSVVTANPRVDDPAMRRVQLPHFRRHTQDTHQRATDAVSCFCPMRGSDRQEREERHN
jgi:hypothetical protein